MNSLAEIIYNKPLEECSEEDLNRLTSKYPYFNAGHLLLVKKSKLEKSTSVSEFLQKASLYFHPSLLNAVLTDAGKSKIIFTANLVLIAQPVIQTELETIEEVQLSTTNTPAEPDKIEPAINTEHSISNTEQQPVTSSRQPLTSNEPLAFEPFHTVDYFASQGIKIKLDENATDKFSKQLKSFTEWLRTMKKLPVGENIEEPAAIQTIEHKVAQLAETSLTNADVITEAMAEVWEKQGNPEKAVEIYQKLSLLEPSKSPYFATRISDLKKTN